MAFRVRSHWFATLSAGASCLLSIAPRSSVQEANGNLGRPLDYGLILVIGQLGVLISTWPGNLFHKLNRVDLSKEHLLPAQLCLASFLKYTTVPNSNLNGVDFFLLEPVQRVNTVLVLRTNCQFGDCTPDNG
jgi:hypothetical protein